MRKSKEFNEAFNNIADIRRRVDEISKQAEKDAGNYMRVIGRCTVVFDFNRLAKDHPQEWARQKKIIKNFFERHKSI